MSPNLGHILNYIWNENLNKYQNVAMSGSHLNYILKESLNELQNVAKSWVTSELYREGNLE